MAHRARRAATILMSALAAAATVLPSSVQAADIVQGVYAFDPGVCGNTRVLGAISNKFRHQVTHVPNLPQVGIVDFVNMRENRYQPASENWPIERRYCYANVALSNGHMRDIWYLIEHPMGFASIGSNVEFCVLGFDRWKVYGGDCRVLR